MIRARYSGLAAIGVLWAGTALAVTRTGFPLLGEHALSHLANDPRGDIAFSGALATSALLFAIFAVNARDRFNAGNAFVAVMSLGMAGQFVAALVPIGDPGRANWVHVSSALLLGASIPVFQLAFALRQAPGTWRRVALALFALQVVASLVGVWLSARGVAPLAEILPAATFHLWVAALTVKPRIERSEVPYDTRPTFDLVGQASGP